MLNLASFQSHQNKVLISVLVAIPTSLSTKKKQKWRHSNFSHNYHLLSFGTKLYFIPKNLTMYNVFIQKLIFYTLRNVIIWLHNCNL